MGSAGGRLDWMILELFSNPNDSMILREVWKRGCNGLSAIQQKATLFAALSLLSVPLCCLLVLGTSHK